MHPDSVVNPLCGWLAARSIGGDNQDFVTGVTEVLDYPKHRVGDAVDIREERLCDDRNAHNQIVPSAADAKVANRDMTREKPVRTMGGAKRLAPTARHAPSKLVFRSCAPVADGRLLLC